MRSRTTRLEPQHEDNEDSDLNVVDHQDDEDQNEEDEEGDNYPFPRYRRRSGEFHFQTHTPRYYGRSHTPPRGVLPTQPPRLQSMGQIRTQSSMEGLRGLLPHAHAQAQPHPYTDSRQQFYSQHSDLDSYPDPYPRPHARPHVQDRGRDIYSSRSSHSSSLPSISSSPSRSQIEPSPIQRDYVLIQPQTQLSVPVLKQSFLQQTQPRMQSQPQLAQAQTFHSSTTTTTTTTTSALPPVPTSISAAPSVSLPASSTIPHSSVPVSVPASLSNKRGLSPSPPPSSFSTSSALLSKKIVKAKPDKPGESVKRASWEYVDLEEDGDELVSVSVSEGSSSVGGIVGLGVVSGDSGLCVGSGTSFGLGHPFPIAQQPQSTKQLQPITKHPSMNQQQCRLLELQYQQSDVQTRLHVEPDSDESEDGGATTAAGGDATSVLISELITTAPAASSIAKSTTAIIDNSQPPSLNSIPHSIPRPILPLIPNSSSSPNPESNPDSSPNLEFDARTNNQLKHTHTHSHSHFSNYSHPGFHSDSYVAHMEDTTDSELDLDLDDDLNRDLDVGVSTVQRVGDALLPSLGYLDEALSFIAEERARWSAAREGGAVGAGGSASVDAGFSKGGGETTENRKVLGRFPFSSLQYISWVVSVGFVVLVSMFGGRFAFWAFIRECP